MSISYIGSGPAYAVANNPTDPAWPSGHEAGDFGLLLIATANQPMSAPSGWTEIGSSYGVGTAGGVSGSIAVQAFFKWATSSSESAPVVPDTGNLTICQVHAYRGVNSTTPLDISKVGFTSSGTTITLSSTAVSNSNCKVIAHVASDYGVVSTSIYSSSSGGNTTNLSEILDIGTTAGVGGSSAAYHGDLATSPTGDLTVSIPSSSTWVGVILVLRPAQAIVTFSSAGVSSSSLLATWTGGGRANVTITGNGAFSPAARALFRANLSAAGASTFSPEILIPFHAHGTSSCSLLSAQIQRFAPLRVFGSSYTSDGNSITFPYYALAGFTAEHADPITGDWRQLIQALLYSAKTYLDTIPPSSTLCPQTVELFMLEDWRRKDARFGRHMKRSFTLRLITKPPISNVVEE